MLLGANRTMRRATIRPLAFVVTILLAWAIVAAHGPMAGGHMGRDMGKAMAVCLAVVQATAAIAIVRRVRRRRRAAAQPVLRPLARRVLAPAVLPQSVIPAARGGPARLQVFRL